jgi:hypothetical protein
MSNEMTKSGVELSAGMKAEGAVALAFQTREMIETLGMMQMAKMSPRNPDTVSRRLMDAAKNESLAVAAEYIYVKGGTEVTGLSIRAAEALAKAYGNIDFGMREVEVTKDKTTCQAYCWDMETNTRQCEIFTVPHSRTKGIWDMGRRVGTEVVQITDQRELDEITRSRGARIKRGCILGVIPIDVQEEFADACERTLAAKIGKMVEKRGESGGIREVIDGMLKKLDSVYKVTRRMVCDRFQRKSEDDLYNLDNRQVVMLYRILTGLRDGIAVPADYFKGASTDRATGQAATPQNAPKAAKDALRAKLGVGKDKDAPKAADAPEGGKSASGANPADKAAGDAEVLDLI